MLGFNSAATAGSMITADVLTREAMVTFPKGMALREVERCVILETLKMQRFNRTRAAKVLGIGIRTLQRKLKQYRGDDTVSVAS